ncbi:MAG: diacylglycerol kinase family protein [Deltaproteobacteria bacterium]
MQYAIITNPVSGKMGVDQKRAALAPAAQILKAEIHGLHTTTSDEFIQCARELAGRCDVLVAAGGDGTLSDVINAVDTSRICIGYLPLGSGNAFAHALSYKGRLVDTATRILEGEIHEYDLVSCDGRRRAFTASLGFEGAVIRLRDQYVDEGMTGMKAYIKALLDAYFTVYKRTNARVVVDGEAFDVPNLLSLMVVKQPYYGYGMNVVPRARFDDRRLHILCTNAGFLSVCVGMATAFVVGNRVGRYTQGEHLHVVVEKPLLLQTDGNLAWESSVFCFDVLKKALRIKG